MGNKLRVLILEDLPSDAELAKRELKTVLNNYTVKVVDNEKDYVQALEEFKPDLILSDYSLPTFDGLSALRIRQDKWSNIPFVLLTGSINEETAVKCILAGADDYVIKGHIKRLGSAVLGAIEKKKIERVNNQTKIALINSELQNRAINETASDAIISINDLGLVSSWNQAAQKVFGYSFSEILNKKLTAILPSKHKLGHESGIKGLRSGNDEKLIGKTIEITAIRKNGEEFPIELSLSSWTVNDKKHFTGIIRDITERRQAEESIREKTEQVNAIVESSQEWIWALDLQGIHTYSNPAVEQILGYSAKKLVGNSSFDLMHEDDRKMIATKMPLWISAKRGWKALVIRWKHINGEWRYLESSAVPIIDVNGNVAGFRGVDRDITERRQAEKVIRDSEERLKILFESAPDAYYLNDLKGNFLDGNKAAEDLMGYKKEELVGANFLKLKLLSAKDTFKASKLLLKNLQGKSTGPDEFTLNRRDGSQITTEISTHPVKIKGKAVVLGIARDITERRKFISDLMEREEKYRTLTYNLNVGVFRSTLGKNGKFVESNPAFLKIFGFRSKSDLERWKVEDFYPNPIERKSYEEKLASKGYLINEEIQLKKKDGTLFIASITSTVAKDESGKIIYYDGIIGDVTEAHKTHEDIIAYQSNLKSLTNELFATEERDKRHLATTLHDKLGQSLALANFNTDELKKRTKDVENKKIINDISLSLDEAINEARNITYELSPPVLYKMGLIPAISWKLDEIEKNNKIKTSLVNKSKSYILEENVQIILYRTIAELLQNVIKHAKAQTVNITMKLLKNSYQIIIVDDGIGFNLARVRKQSMVQKKFGLFSIIERIGYIGGEVNINSELNNGTKVVIDLPIKD